jgi:hypothetical protein
MNTTQSRAARRFEYGALMLAGATLLGSTTLAAPGEAEQPEEAAPVATNLTLPQSLDSLREALLSGTFWVTFRYRYETVEQDGNPKDARASTLRTRLGYKTGNYHGFTGVLEFSDVSNVGPNGDDYDNGTGNSTRPIVVDPTGTVVNQVYLNYGAAIGDIRLGRQRIKLDNYRFIGNVDWRQTEQTFDSISYNKELNGDARVFYAYLDNVNTVEQTNEDSSSHLLNVSVTAENIGTLSGYGYYLDFENQSALSTFTYGARFAGERVNGDWGVVYAAELAQQVDIEDNTNDVDALYSHVNFGGNAKGGHIKVGFESLEGGSNAASAFQTPLGTRHAFNGWADLFAFGTPQQGLEDTYLDLGYGNNVFEAGIVLHQFETERGSGADYGDELDLYAKYNIDDDFRIGVSYADFNADGDNPAGFEDTQKFWVWLGFEF